MQKEEYDFLLFMEQTLEHRQQRYGDVPNKLACLAKDCGVECSDETMSKLGVFAHAVECVDRHVDSTVCDDTRHNLQREILAAFEGRNALSDGELQTAVVNLRAITNVQELNIFFAEAIREIFRLGERVRTTQNTREYFQLRMQEGALIGSLGSNLVPENTERLEDTLAAIGALANVVDSLCDAQHDFAAQEIQVRPNRMFYVHGVRAMLAAAAEWMVTQPNKLHAVWFLQRVGRKVWNGVLHQKEVPYMQ